MIPKEEVIVYVPIYNDLPAFKRLHESCRKLGLRVLVGDGVFHGFLKINGLTTSSDGFYDYIRDKDDIKLFTMEDACYEEEKLNCALDTSSRLGCKWMILLGSDCYLSGNIEEFLHNLEESEKLANDESNLFMMKINEEMPDDKYQQNLETLPLLFYKPEGLEAKYTHWMMFRRGETKRLRAIQFIVEGLTVNHDSKIRDDQRNKMMSNYQDWNVQREKERLKDYKINAWGMNPATMKKQVIVYIPIYNDFDAFKRAYKSCKRLGFTVMVGDGRFKNDSCEFPQINGDDFSTDGLVEFCEKHSDIIYFYHEPAPEETKLNYAMKMAHEMGYKIFIMIGSDAYLEGDSELFCRNLFGLLTHEEPDLPVMFELRVNEHKINDKWNADFKTYPRVWLNFDMMEIRNLHWLVYRKGARDTEYLRKVGGLVRGLEIHHDNSIRTKERDELMTKYQDENVPRERSIWYDRVECKMFRNIKFMVEEFTIEEYTKIREKFLSPENKDCTHLILVDKQMYDLMKHDRQCVDYSGMFKRVIEEYNNVVQHLPVISAVYTFNENEFVVRPVNTDVKRLPTERLKEMYSRCQLNLEDPVLITPYLFGPIVCIEREVVKDIENFSDLEDFVVLCVQLGYGMYVDTRIQVPLKEKT